MGLTQQLSTENIFYDGNNREYIIYIPQIYSPSVSTPILFAFHGGSGFVFELRIFEKLGARFEVSYLVNM